MQITSYQSDWTIPCTKAGSLLGAKGTTSIFCLLDATKERHGEMQRKNSVTIDVICDEEQPIGRLLIEELPEQRHGAAGPTAPISGSLLFAGTRGAGSTPAIDSVQSFAIQLKDTLHRESRPAKLNSLLRPCGFVAATYCSRKITGK